MPTNYTAAAIALDTKLAANIAQDQVEKSAEFRENMYVKLPAHHADPKYMALLSAGCFAPEGWWKTYQKG